MQSVSWKPIMHFDVTTLDVVKADTNSIENHARLAMLDEIINLASRGINKVLLVLLLLLLLLLLLIIAELSGRHRQSPIFLGGGGSKSWYQGHT